MKEMPGAPALPEGWFYRVTSRRYGTSGRSYCVAVRRPFLWGTVRWGKSRVYDCMGGTSYDFYISGRKPTNDQLVRAAEKAYGKSDPDTIEGDYR